jgi:YD repeat-containing protein
LLPKKNSFAVDYWGYFNGSNNINGFLNLTVLGYPQFTENDSNNFNSNLNYAKANILEKIIYPTKGYTKFEYELNEFDNLIAYHGTNTPIINYGAGLRIKSVTNFNFDDNIISKKNYSYYGGKSLLKRVLTKESFQHWSDCNRIVSETTIVTSSNSNCINQSNNIEGDYIGYDKVIIKEEGSTDNGSIEKTFSNSEFNAINPYNEFTSAQYYLNPNSIDNGSLLTEKIFDSTNHLKLSKQYKYQNVVANLDTYGMAVQSDGVRVVYGTHGNDNIINCTDIVVLPRCLLTFYPIYDKFSRLIEESSYESFDSGSFAKKSMFEYDSKNNLVVKTDKVLPNTIISKTVTSMTYNNNINHLNKHIFKLPLEKRVQENETLEKSTNYFYDDLQYTKLARIEEHSRGGNSDEFTRKIFYDLYDNKNNVLEYHLENGIYTSIIWGYRQTLPIAKIENIRYSDLESYIGTIQNTSNEIDSSELFNQLKAFRTLISSQFPNAMITTFTHLPLVGVETITDPKGKTNTYTYDSLNRLQYVKDNDGNILSENEYHFRP